MKILYMAWQNPQTRAWHTVGQLTKERDVYCFVYTQGALSEGFSYLGRMIDKTKPYYSRELFPLFANRILNKKRPEYPDYLNWLGFNKNQEPMQLLARSGGKRATDNLCVYPYPETNAKGENVLYFLSHGLRYLDKKALASVESLQKGNCLSLRSETNKHDEFALVLETNTPVKVGYCPRYLNRDFRQILTETKIYLTVERLNKDAPLQFRLLCKAVFKLPLGFKLFSSEEYQVLVALDKPLKREAA